MTEFFCLFVCILISKNPNLKKRLHHYILRKDYNTAFGYTSKKTTVHTYTFNQMFKVFKTILPTYSDLIVYFSWKNKTTQERYTTAYFKAKEFLFSFSKNTHLNEQEEMKYSFQEKDAVSGQSTSLMLHILL